MRRAFLAPVGAILLALAGCGADSEKSVSDDAPEAQDVPEDVGVSTSALTNCARTELANVVVSCGGNGFHCDFRLMENNFVCSEGVVGQASTETLTGIATTTTVVTTKLFEESHDGIDNQWLVPATIATQWGHAYGSAHYTWCLDRDGAWHGAAWHMDPWSKRAVPEWSCR